MVFIPNFNRFKKTRSTGRLQINWNNPLTANLKSLIVANETGFIDLVAERQLEAVSPVFAGIVDNYGASVNATNYFKITGLKPLNAVTDSISCFAQCYKTSTSGTKKPVIAYTDSSGNLISGLNLGTGSTNRYQLETRTSGGTSPVGSPTITPTANQTNTFAITRNTGLLNSFLYSLNGITDTHSAGSGGSTTNLAGEISEVYIGASRDLSLELNGIFFIGGFFNKFSNQENLNAITEYPYQLVKSNPRIFSLGSVDTTGPIITGISASGISASGATVSWSTDEDSDSVVEYGLTAGYGSNVSSGTLTTSHSLNIESLTANTLYHYRVKSTDASSNESISSDQTFTTAEESVGSTKIFALLGVG